MIIILSLIILLLLFIVSILAFEWLSLYHEINDMRSKEWEQE